jgi:glycyl-tRNA synthetase beta chain
MTGRHDFLFEVGTEELPPGALLTLGNALGEAIRSALNKANLGFDDLRTYATARRLAVVVERLAEVQPDTIEERRGPALTAAFDEDGRPTPAAIGFARSCGVEVEALERLESGKGVWLVARKEYRGRDVRELLPGIVTEALASLPIPRRMRWGALEATFVRPVHWLVMLYGEEVIPLELFGLVAGRETRGHRFHCSKSLYLERPAAYLPLLETEGHVIADFAQRREAVRAQVAEAAAAVDAHADLDEALLDEVTAIVEWPRAVTGRFEERFLELPDEVLISVMKQHQKYFHLRDAQSRLLPRFITISNIESREPDVVRAGNERVIRPRLSDAMFFWSQDRRRRLDARIDDLAQVVFQRGLGTLYQKSERIARLAVIVARESGGDAYPAERAAWLSKCDLMTDMVGEFPELQGIMGGYYAAHDGEPAEVAAAVAEHYQPRSAGDGLPSSAAGAAVAIADRLDTLAGIFGLDRAPSGDKDPFALRRAALGVLRIMIDSKAELDLLPLVDAAFEGYRQQGIAIAHGKAVREQLHAFMMERLRAWYHDAGIGSEIFDAVLSRRVSRPADFDARVRAVRMFRDLPEAESLAAANKRIANILRKSGVQISGQVDAGLLRDAEERSLAAALEERIREVTPLIGAGGYAEALKRLAGLREPVDAFFDKVLVMCDDTAMRDNRLALLQRLHRQFMQVADLSCLFNQGDARGE